MYRVRSKRRDSGGRTMTVPREPIGGRGHEVVDSLHEGLRDAMPPSVDASRREPTSGELLDLAGAPIGSGGPFPPVDETHPIR